MTRSTKQWILGAGAMAVGSAAWYALRIEPDLVEASETELPLPRWAAAPLRILFLSDTHHWDWGLREERTLTLVAEATAAPDLIVWGGDYVGHDRGVATAIRFCRAVAARWPGVPMVAVRGNAEHKLTADRLAVLESGMGDCGVRWLVNDSRLVSLGETRVRIAGCDDPYYGFCDLDKTLAECDGPEPCLLVAHSPQVVARAAVRGVDAVLSGHTHGGQVRLPGIGAVRTQNPLSRRIDAGVFDRGRLAQCLGRDPGGETVLFVGRGIGLAFVPRMPWLAPRLACRPEVAWLTLRAPIGEVGGDAPE